MASSTTSSPSSNGYPANEDQTQCLICDKQFTFTGSQHIHYKYSDCKYVYCTRCQTVFPTPTALNAHLRSVHGPPLIFCSGCATWYADVAEGRWEHKGRCFGGMGFEGAGFDFGGAQAGGGAKEERGSEGKEKDKEKEGAQWSEFRSSSKRQQEKERSKADNNKKEEDQPKSEHRSHPAGNDKPIGRSSSDLYARLRVHPLSTDAAIAQAAKKRRIEVHPDRARKPGMTERELHEIDEIAKDVGYAADVLQDAEKKRRYDRERTGRR